MKKFTQYKKQEEKKEVQTTFNHDDYKLIKYDGKQLIDSVDKVVILPHLKEENFILLQYEANFNYHFKLKDKPNYKNVLDFLSVIKRPIEEGGNAISTIRKTLLENGIVLNAMFPVEVDKILFQDENKTGQYYIALLEIYHNDYKFIKGSEETKIIKIDLGHLDDINTVDLITDYMILKLKNILKI